MSEKISLKIDGAPSLEELQAAGMLPSVEELERKACVCIECIEEIPCNPCETSCSQNAISVGLPITNLPVIDREKCTACGLCIPACPGLAITIKSIQGDKARIRFPWEYLPMPNRGERVAMVDRMGEVRCEGLIISTQNIARNNRTAVVTAEFSKEFVQEIVSMRRLHEEL
ncbi:MAG: 4Fe-4S binding protein [Rectinema sp.]|jgi:Fe-S-cluster-containing hydrogenase component 2|nr:4Fe-4S binding protein [Rectinema sp.]